jgi:valyl-tRNA synthetase
MKNYLPYLNRFSFSQVEPLTPSINVAMMKPFLYERGKMFIQAKISKAMLIETLQKELAVILSEISRAEGLLSNTNFVQKAPAQKIKEENDKLELYRRKKDELETKLHHLK